MNEFDFIAVMLWELNMELERQSGFQHSSFRDYHNRLSRLLHRAVKEYEPVPAPEAMTIRKACEIAQNRVGLTMAPLIRCWTMKPNYNCAIGFGGAGRDHTIMGAGDTWEQALNAMDAWLAGTKVQCNICNRPDCDTPNQKH